MKGRELVERRKALGLNQSQAAEFLQVDRTSLARWERSNELPYLAAIAVDTLLKPGETIDKWVCQLKPAARSGIMQRAAKYASAPAGAEEVWHISEIGHYPSDGAVEQAAADFKQAVIETAAEKPLEQPHLDPITAIHPLRDDPETMPYAGIKRGGPDPVAEFRRDTLDDAAAAPDDSPIASGGQLEKLRFKLKRIVAAHGGRAIRELSEVTGIERPILEDWLKNDGHISVAQFTQIMDVIRESELA